MPALSKRQRDPVIVPKHNHVLSVNHGAGPWIPSLSQISASESLSTRPFAQNELFCQHQCKEKQS